MLDIDIFTSGTFERVTLDRVHLHDRKGTARGVASKVSWVDNDGTFEDRASKGSQLGRNNQHVRLARHLPMVHMFHVKIRQWRRWKQRIVVSLLEHVLGNTAKARTNLQVGIRFVGANVEEGIRRRYTHNEFVNFEGAGVRDAVYTAMSNSLTADRLDVLKTQCSDFDSLSSWNLEAFGSSCIAIRQGSLGVPTVK